MSKKHLGSSVDDFLKKENIFEEAQAQAIKEVVAWQLAKAMKKKKISKARMAALLKTSRSQVDRILDPKHDITLSSLQRAAALVGHRVMIELVWVFRRDLALNLEIGQSADVPNRTCRQRRCPESGVISSQFCAPSPETKQDTRQKNRTSTSMNELTAPAARS